MSFLLDTNVVSEWVKPQPSANVCRWLTHADEDDLYLSVVTIGELRFGIERLAAGARRDRLRSWVEDDLPARFDARILVIDLPTADLWGRLMAKARAVGRPVAAVDTLIGATAERHGLTVVTRNTGDFASLGIRILDPWHIV